MLLKIYWDLCTIDWTALAGVFSFLMIVVTVVSLFQNKKQLKEMKRQWNEQNTPVVSCSLEKCKDNLLLEIHNTSQAPAHKVRIQIVNNTGKSIFHFEETCKLLDNMTFEIPPFSVKRIPIFMTPYIDGEYEGYLTVTISYSGKCDKFELYLKEINLTAWSYSIKDICKDIEALDSTIKQKFN